jgi:protein O-mannosyl-transferase
LQATGRNIVLKKRLEHSLQKPEDELPDARPNEKGLGCFSRTRWLRALALFGLLLAAYIPALRGGFIWDDDDYVTGNQTLRTLAGLFRIWFDPTATPQYYPLVHTSFWIEHHIWGGHALGYHAVNLALHALSAVLLYCLLTRLALPGAWIAAAIFALHPVELESVAWITERKNVLSAVFYLSASLAFLRFAVVESPGRPERRRWSCYFLSLILFVAALLSKSVACSLPAAMLLVLWWKGRRLGWVEIWPLTPFFILGAASGLATAWLEKHHVRAEGADWSLNFTERVLIAGRAVWFYAGKLLWPTPLTFSYPRWQIDAGVWWQWLFPAAALGVVALLWGARNRVGRGPLTAALFFVGTLGPALGFVNIYPMRYTFVADHYQYLASIGVIALACVWLSRMPLLVVSLLLATLAALTWHQGHIYRNIETLWQDTLAKNPDSWLAHDYLGDTLLAKKQFEEALGHFGEAVRLNQRDAVGWFNSGCALLGEGKLDDAIQSFQEAIRVRPQYGRAQYYLGLSLARRGRVDEAIDAYQKALELNSADSAILGNLAGALMAKGRFGDAAARLRQAVRLHPEVAALHYNLGVALAYSGQLEEAIGEYQESLNLNPASADAHKDLGAALAAKGRVKEAIDQFSQALRLQPNDAEAQQQLRALAPPQPP